MTAAGGAALGPAIANRRFVPPAPIVIAGLVPAIHVFDSYAWKDKTWMAGPAAGHDG
jgi:hypothetical protein